jgi:hypothetical protein
MGMFSTGDAAACGARAIPEMIGAKQRAAGFLRASGRYDMKLHRALEGRGI